jgi:hypothetical protein
MVPMSMMQRLRRSAVPTCDYEVMCFVGIFMAMLVVDNLMAMAISLHCTVLKVCRIIFVQQAN